MNGFRVAVLGTIAFLALLMVSVALVAAIFDVSDRGMTVISNVLMALTGLVGSVIVYLKVDGLDAKADDAKSEAASARAEAQKAARIGAEVHHDIRNDVLKDRVKAAILESESDPEVQQLRIERIAKGVSKDRHELRTRRTRERLRAQLEERGLPVPPRSDDEP